MFYLLLNWWILKLLQVIASENQPVRWTTPLGLPVVQPYCRSERHLVSVSLVVYLHMTKPYNWLISLLEVEVSIKEY